MKIHMDYLENKLENIQSKDSEVGDHLEQLERQLDVANDKIKMLKEARTNEQQAASRKIDELREQNRLLQKRNEDADAHLRHPHQNQRQLLSQVSPPAH